MSEKFDTKKFISKEREVLIAPESGYFKALSFANDPVPYVSDYIEGLRADGFPPETLCQQVLAELMELEDIIGNYDIAVSDVRVAEMLRAEYGSQEWVVVTFGLLKQAGLNKEQALNWVVLDDHELTNEELLKERTTRYYIQKIYDEIT